MQGWKPIETRPDEGEFLAYDPVSKKQDVCEASVEDIWGPIDTTALGKAFTNRRGKIGERKSCRSTQSDGEYGPEDDDFNAHRATLWMHLPEPPK